MNPDYPCLCGHPFNRHRKIINNSRGTSYCRGCFNYRGGSKENWHEFVPDNLKYLEQLNEKMV